MEGGTFQMPYRGGGPCPPSPRENRRRSFPPRLSENEAEQRIHLLGKEPVNQSFSDSFFAFAHILTVLFSAAVQDSAFQLSCHVQTAAFHSGLFFGTCQFQILWITVSKTKTDADELPVSIFMISDI